MTDDTCQDCKYWKRVVDRRPEFNTYGSCRVRPRQRVSTLNSSSWEYPHQHETDWCGEFDHKDGPDRFRVNR